MWQETIEFLGGATILLSATAWLIRSILVHFLGKDIEKFKQQLQIEAEKELTTLRGTLELENTKLQIKLSTLEARRISFIEELYKYLIDLNNEASGFAIELIHFDDNDKLKEKADKFIDSYSEFYSYFEKHEFFLPKYIADQIKSLHEAHVNNAFTIYYNEEKSQQKEAIDMLKKSAQDISAQNRLIQKDIIKELRKLLCVDY